MLTRLLLFSQRCQRLKGGCRQYLSCFVRVGQLNGRLMTWPPDDMGDEVGDQMAQTVAVMVRRNLPP